MKKHTDADLIEKLGSDKKSDRQEAMLFLYENKYEQVKHYILKNSGEVSEVDDVFQDSIVALYKHARAGRFDASTQVQAYFFTICKNTWLKKLRKKGRTVELTEQYENQVEGDTQENIMITEERSKLLEELLSGLGTVCYQLLRFYYYERRRMNEIAELLSLTNTQAAKDKKASCMKKLRKQVQANPVLIELLK